MFDFLSAAFPWVLIGCLVAYAAAQHRKKPSEPKQKQLPERTGTLEIGTEEPEPEGNYMTEGMSIGMCLGVAVSVATHKNLALGISFGMLFGMVIGMNKHRKE